MRRRIQRKAMAYEDGTGKVGSSDEAAGIVRIQRRI